MLGGRHSPGLKWKSTRSWAGWKMLSERAIFLLPSFCSYCSSDKLNLSSLSLSHFLSSLSSLYSPPLSSRSLSPHIHMLVILAVKVTDLVTVLTWSQYSRNHALQLWCSNIFWLLYSLELLWDSHRVRLLAWELALISVVLFSGKCRHILDYEERSHMMLQS